MLKGTTGIEAMAIKYFIKGAAVSGKDGQAEKAYRQDSI